MPSDPNEEGGDRRCTKNDAERSPQADPLVGAHSRGGCRPSPEAPAEHGAHSRGGWNARNKKVTPAQQEIRPIATGSRRSKWQSVDGTPAIKRNACI
jgi:hypothetical protein